MIDYKDSKIYKLLDDFDDLLYVGSTCKTLDERKTNHRGQFNYGTDKFLYKYLKTIERTIDDCKIVLIENYPCVSKYELHKRERHFIDTLKPRCNTQIPTRTPKEWEADNRPRRRIYQRLWERRNKDRRNLHRREHRVVAT